MSVRAHRVIVEAQIASQGSFNLADTELLEALTDLENTFYTESGDRLEINVGELRSFLKTATDVPDYARTALEADLATCKNDDDYLVYECF